MDNNFSNSLLSTLPYSFAPPPSENSYARITFTYQYKPNKHEIVGVNKSEIWHFGNAYLDLSEEDKKLTLEEIGNQVNDIIERLTNGSKTRYKGINIMFNIPCENFGDFGGTE